MHYHEEISDVSRETLERFQNLIKKWNKRINLVARASEDDIWNRHILNSSVLHGYLSDDEHILDLGSGGGFPGIILSILSSNRTVHLVESDQRKAVFLKEASRSLKLNTIIHNVRVEDLPSVSANVITSRAFASVKRTFELTKNFHTTSLRFLLLKGKNVDEELSEAGADWVFRAKKHPTPSQSDGCILEVTHLERR